METKIPEKRIELVWFTQFKIYIRTEDGIELSLPLEVFPALMEATDEQRAKYRINHWRDAIHWQEIDEDIHVSSFFENETVNYDNEVNRLLSRLPWIDMRSLAEYLGMHWTKLARFRYGVWTPSDETLDKIRKGIVALGKEMIAVAG